MMNPPNSGARYINRYNVEDDLPIVSLGEPRYVNSYIGEDAVPVVSRDPIIVGTVPYDGPTWGMMNPPGNNYVDANRYVNYGGTADDHIARCEARYRSYDAATNSFLGYDGLVHQCAL